MLVPTTRVANPPGTGGSLPESPPASRQVAKTSRNTTKLCIFIYFTINSLKRALEHLKHQKKSFACGELSSVNKQTITKELKEGLTYIRTGSAAYFWLIGFLVNFLCIVAPPVETRSRRVRFGFFNRKSYVWLTSRQHLATVIRYADCVKQRFRPSRRC